MLVSVWNGWEALRSIFEKTESVVWICSAEVTKLPTFLGNIRAFRRNGDNGPGSWLERNLDLNSVYT